MLLIHVNIHMNNIQCTQMHAHVHTHTCMHTFPHEHIHMHARTCTHMQTEISVHIYTCNPQYKQTEILSLDAEQALDMNPTPLHNKNPGEIRDTADIPKHEKVHI